jgi:hypothetical protein
MMAASPTQLTLRELRRRGYRAQVVEHWNSHAFIRQDLFGIIDVIAVGNGETVGVQATSYKNVASRVTKIAESEAIADIRDAGWKVLVHGWRKPKHRWELREVDVS